MCIGDWVGTVLVLAFVSLLIKGFKRTGGSFNR
jgi:hypothetical protein